MAGVGSCRARDHVSFYSASDVVRGKKNRDKQASSQNPRHASGARSKMDTGWRAALYHQRLRNRSDWNFDKAGKFYRIANVMGRISGKVEKARNEPEALPRIQMTLRARSQSIPDLESSEKAAHDGTDIPSVKRARYLSYMQTYNAEYRANLKRLGLCRDCKAPSHPFTRCRECRFIQNVKTNPDSIRNYKQGNRHKDRAHAAENGGILSGVRDSHEGSHARGRGGKCPMPASY